MFETHFKETSQSALSKSIQLIGLSLAIGVFGFAAPAFAQSDIFYDINGFSRIQAEAGMEVIYKPGSNYSVEASFENGVEDILRVKKRGSTLYVGRKTKNGWADGTVSLTVTVTSPSITSIKANSGARVTAEGIDATDLIIRAASGARVKAEGSCSILKSQSDSGAMIDVSAVQCDQVVAKAYSGGELRVYAGSSITTRTDSGGIVRVYGSPEDRNVKAAKGYYGGRTTFEGT